MYTIATYKNRLYIGGESGSAVFGKSLDKLSSANFYDPSLWEVDSSIAPVHSFYEDSGKLLPSPGFTARYSGYLFTSDTSAVTAHFDDPATFFTPSNVTAMKTIGPNTTLIGTEEDFFYYLDPDEYVQIKIPGPTFASANRVLVDRTGQLWVLPFGLAKGFWNPGPWWLGINAFDGSSWKNYSPSAMYDMGHMGSATEANAIVQTDDGRMWFGFKGGSIKCFDPDNGEWWHYCNFGQEGIATFVKRKGSCPSFDWGKCDAIAQDSSGYMWFGSWNNLAGCLLCYKPSPDENDDLEGRYRRFPPLGYVNADITINTIAVDPDQNILFGTKEGILTVVRHNGNPIRDGIISVKEFRNLQNVYQIVVLGDGTSLVLTAGGVMLFDPSDKTLSVMDEFETGITRLVVENDNLFWYTVAGDGVVRFDFLNNKKTIYNRAQGLVATSVNDLFVDRSNGCIWVASDQGVSRIALGYTSPSAGEDPSVVIYPNPFSLRRHTTMHFRNVPSDAVVGIYALNGNLVGTPSMVIGSESRALYQWKPSSRCAPGTYFYSIVTSASKKSGTVLIVP